MFSDAKSCFPDAVVGAGIVFSVTSPSISPYTEVLLTNTIFFTSDFFIAE